VSSSNAMRDYAAANGRAREDGVKCRDRLVETRSGMIVKGFAV